MAAVVVGEREREAVRARMSEFSSLVEPPSASRIDPTIVGGYEVGSSLVRAGPSIASEAGPAGPNRPYHAGSVSSCLKQINSEKNFG